ncbi:MAG: prolipoprotein diacylglyceryl transferase [Bacteroidetes bacterium]|nr:prolipoprotein diacylglyceryl transferase [Bacteroidota bacterium]
MYPRITDLLRDFGINIPIELPVQTFGFFVAIAFLSAAWALGAELKRKEKEGLLSSRITKVKIGEPVTAYQILINVLIGFVVGFKLAAVLFDYSSCASNPQEFLISSTGSFPGGIIGAVILGVWRWWSGKKQQLDEPRIEDKEIHPHEMVGDIVVIVMVSSLIGAKVFHYLEYPEDLLNNPLDNIFAGLTFYGGLIFGATAGIYYARKMGLKLLPFLDTTGPAIMLGYAVGRIGCQMSGDGDWGIANLAVKPSWLGWLPDWAWSFNYPNNVINAGVPIPGCTGDYCMVLAESVWPTPFYETVMCLFLFGMLWMIRKRVQVPGVLFGIYLVLNGIERFAIESIRVNATYQLFGGEITQAQIISTLLVIGGVAWIVYLNKNKTVDQKPASD